MSNIKNAIFDLPVIGKLLEAVYEIPVFGFVFVIILGLFFLNKFLITQFNVNLLKGAFSLLFKRDPKTKYDRAREKFFNTASTLQFGTWQTKLLEKIYDDLPLVTLYNKTHVTVVQKAAENIVYPFHKNMQDFMKLNNKHEVPIYEPNKKQKYYYNIVEENIKQPNLIGFELDQFILNDEDEITSFEANICQYRHTVLTCHYLDFELYELYLKNKEIINKSREDILQALPERKKIHANLSNREVLLTGKNRHALLSVQMMVVSYDDIYDDYRLIVFKRSEDVAIKPGYWQIVPAGGFEIFEKEGMDNPHVIEQNFDIQLALFREFLEELFNGRDFEDNEVGHDRDYIIYNHPVIVKLEALLKEGQAHLQFLGNVTDLTTLRSELSFLLVIDDAEFFKRKFQRNFEGVVSQRVRVNELEEMFTDDLLYPSSAGLMKLARKSPLFQKCLSYNER